LKSASRPSGFSHGKASATGAARAVRKTEERMIGAKDSLEGELWG
jgi:hypothetical protein